MPSAAADLNFYPDILWRIFSPQYFSWIFCPTGSASIALPSTLHMSYTLPSHRYMPPPSILWAASGPASILKVWAVPPSSLSSPPLSTISTGGGWEALHSDLLCSEGDQWMTGCCNVKLLLVATLLPERKILEFILASSF
jgi:hypothetical protein